MFGGFPWCVFVAIHIVQCVHSGHVSHACHGGYEESGLCTEALCGARNSAVSCLGNLQSCVCQTKSWVLKDANCVSIKNTISNNFTILDPSSYNFVFLFAPCFLFFHFQLSWQKDLPRTKGDKRYEENSRFQTVLATVPAFSVEGLGPEK